MRWIAKSDPRDGEIKIKRKFALFPIRIGNEVRWLEWVNIKYRFYRYYFGDPDNIFNDVWVEICFVDQEEK